MVNAKIWFPHFTFSENNMVFGYVHVWRKYFCDDDVGFQKKLKQKCNTDCKPFMQKGMKMHVPAEGTGFHAFIAQRTKTKVAF